MRTLGQVHRFTATDWEHIRNRYATLTSQSSDYRYLEAVATSVIESGRSAQLAGCMSMHDLMVVATPVPEPPYALVIVRSPSSLRRVRPGRVLIEEQSLSGHNDIVERPIEETVPLFWRFMIEKFGVSSRG